MESHHWYEANLHLLGRPSFILLIIEDFKEVLVGVSKELTYYGALIPAGEVEAVLYAMSLLYTRYLVVNKTIPQSSILGHFFFCCIRPYPRNHAH